MSNPDAPIEQLMDVLWTCSEAGLSLADAQWSFSSEFFTQLKAAVRPGLDPFGDSDACLSLPYIVKGAQSEPYVLEERKWKITSSGLSFTPSLRLVRGDLPSAS